MNKRFVLAVIATLGTTVGAQQPAPATAPIASAKCRADANTYQSQALAQARAGNTQIVLPATTTTPILAEAKRQARECADKITVDGASTAELSALIPLYLYVGDTVKARTILATWMGRPSTGAEADRAEALLTAESMAISAFDPFAGINTEAEKYAKQIDAMSDAVLAQKIRAHQSLLGRYGYADIDDGIRDHANKLLVLARRAVDAKSMWVPERPATDYIPATAGRGAVPARPAVPAYDGAYNVMVSAYSDIARAHGDFLHADSALMVLDEAERVIGTNLPNAAGRFASQRTMYNLIGTKATPITGTWWINDKDGATVTPGNAKVTVIQFTAHWCVPCKNSYPGFKRMNEHFMGRPVEAVMVTNTYGYIGTKQGLTPEQEVAEDRDYYSVHHELPFKVAINLPERTPADRAASNDGRYAVSGIPEIVVVDRKGIIRATVVGWDKGNEQRLTALIEKILKEK